jgi:predicted amidophosphoribosyltransferase
MWAQLYYGCVYAKCLSKEKALDGTTTLMPYSFPAAQLIISLQYKNHLYLAHEFGQRLAMKIRALGPPMPDCLVLVPLHPL